MNKRICFGTFVVFSLLVFSMLIVVSDAYWPPLYEENDLPELQPRSCPLNITVVFIGFDPQCINTSYLTWLLPKSKPELVLASGDNWGINYSLTYHYTFTNQSFRTNLENYLATIAIQDPTTLAPPHPYYTIPPPMPSIFYNASTVENYLYTKFLAIGAVPTNGYTAVLMNLSRPWQYVSAIPPGHKWPHYYNVTYKDKDTNTTWPYGKWMLGWGGHYRFWFVDLSAGSWPGANALHPHYSHYGPLAFNPIWWLNYTYPELGGFRTKQGINFLTEYVQDFVQGMVYNLFAPDLEFPARVSKNYEVAIYAFDNCTGKLNKTIPLINSNAILSAFQSLVPNAMWTVNITYIHLNGTTDPPLYSRLWSALRSAESTSTGQLVDFEVLWKFFDANMGSFAASSPGKVVIPIFIIQFKQNYQLVFQGKGLMTMVVWGASVYDMTIIGRNEWGSYQYYGLTQVSIHEAAHCVGLTHPHQNDPLQEFTASALSYYTLEYSFSRFERDIISRAHTDYYMIRAANFIDKTTDILKGKQSNSTLSAYLGWASGNTTQAQQRYNSMDYWAATGYAEAAYTSALKAYQMAGQLPSMTTPPATIYQTLTIGLLVLTGVLVLTIYFMHRKGKHRK